MPTKPLTREQCLDALKTVRLYAEQGLPVKLERGQHGDSAMRQAANALGLSRETIKARIEEAERRFGLTIENMGKPEKLGLGLDEERPDPIELLDRHTPINDRYIEQKRRKPKWIQVPPEPFGFCVVGDPHISNKGTNLRALQDDLELLRASRTYSIQVGDILDNFHKLAKLAPKEAENRMSVSESLSLAQWFLSETGVNWIGHCEGNHDSWLGAEGMTLLRGWARKGGAQLYGWNAEFIFDWGEGNYRVAVAHDFKGNSEYNTLHGPMKMALRDGRADAYICGHRHNHALAKYPNGDREKTYLVARARGYKDRDDYSEGRPQFAALDAFEGRSIFVVIDPFSDTQTGRAHAFEDIGNGLEYLNAVKRRYSNDVISLYS